MSAQVLRFATRGEALAFLLALLRAGGVADAPGHFPDPVNVPPVMAGAVAREDGFDVAGGLVDEI